MYSCCNPSSPQKEKEKILNNCFCIFFPLQYIGVEKKEKKEYAEKILIFG